MNFTPYLVGWVVLAAAAIILMICSAVIGLREDESLHVMESGAHLVTEQQAMFRRVGVIERWMKILFILTIFYGLALGGIHLYDVLQQWM